MKKVLKSTPLILALCISATHLFSSYYGDKIENPDTIEIPENGFRLTKNYKQQAHSDRNFFKQDESTSCICRKN